MKIRGTVVHGFKTTNRKRISFFVNYLAELQPVCPKTVQKLVHFLAVHACDCMCCKTELVPVGPALHAKQQHVGY
jgi:hypothetical protein